MSESSSSKRTPALFLGIGGPNFIENTDHPAYKQLSQIGRHITTTIKPKAIVVFGAHWQHKPGRVAVNVAEHEDLIYDFYGFPAHFYQVKYPNRGSPEVAEKVIQKLNSAGIGVDRVHRGLDHGVWVGTLAAFSPKDNPLNVPIVQVSLYDNDDVEKHYQLGQAVAELRDEGILILGAGMTVHNLADFRASRHRSKPMPYAIDFDESLKHVIEGDPNVRRGALSALLEGNAAQVAHPSLEHVLPIVVAAGAADLEDGKQLWTYPEASVNWAQYSFGSFDAT